jgi:hypothetical protein
LTRLFIDYWRPLTAGRHYHLYAVSPEDPDVGAYGEEILRVSVPNQPLSDKHNALTERLSAGRDLIDGVIVMPSDDFFTPSFLDAAAWALQQGHDAMQIDMLHFYCLETGRCVKGRELNVGAGFMVRRDVLDRLDWRLWTAGKRQWMDKYMMDRTMPQVRNLLRIKDSMNYGGPPFAGMDVKGQVTRNTFEKLWNGLTFQERLSGAMTQEFMEMFFPGIAGELLNWNSKRVV